MLENKITSTDRSVEWFSKPQPGHLVQFYQSDSKLLVPLGEFIGSGLANGDTCVVIATPPHLNGLDEQLTKQGIDIIAARQRSKYVALDASETLTTFMVNGLPDRKRFFRTVGSLVEKTAKNDQPLRAYGEMVALLWKAGNKEAVIQLENLWNELAERYSFSLFCAYPKLHFLWHTDIRNEISDCHNIMLPSTYMA